jgi:hypothetical protein
MEPYPTPAFLREHFRTLPQSHLSAEEQLAYDHLRSSLFDDINPYNALEHQIFEQLVHASWQLTRMRPLEDMALAALARDPEDKQLLRNYNAFLKNRRSLDRTIQLCFAELRRLVTTRVLAVPVDCNTFHTTNTNAHVPLLLDLRETLPPAELRATRNVLSLSLAHLSSPDAMRVDPTEIRNKPKANAA